MSIKVPVEFTENPEVLSLLILNKLLPVPCGGPYAFLL
jgi:hypothetical protein